MHVSSIHIWLHTSLLFKDTAQWKRKKGRRDISGQFSYYALSCEVFNMLRIQCCGSGMFIPDPWYGFVIPSRILDLGSRIQQEKRGGEKISSLNIFYLNIFSQIENYLAFWKGVENFLSHLTKNLSFLTQNIVPRSQNDGLDPGSGKKLIPDPGSKCRGKISRDPGPPTLWENHPIPSCCEPVEACTVSTKAPYAVWFFRLDQIGTWDLISFLYNILRAVESYGSELTNERETMRKFYRHQGNLCSTLESPPPPPFPKAEDQRRYLLTLGQTPTFGNLFFFRRRFIVFYGRVYFYKEWSSHTCRLPDKEYCLDLRILLNGLSSPRPSFPSKNNDDIARNFRYELKYKLNFIFKPSSQAQSKK